MTLVRITDCLHLNPTEVAATRFPPIGDDVVIILRSGEQLRVEPDHGRSGYETYQRIVRVLDEARP